MESIATIAERSPMTEAADKAAGAQLALAKPYPAGRNMSLTPSNLEDAAKLAQLLCKAEMIPKAYQDKPADVLVAILFGADLGLPPMQAIQSIAAVNGKPSLYGDGFLAVVYAQPQFKDHDEYFVVNGQRVEPEDLPAAALTNDETAAVCSFVRVGRSKPTTRKFSIAMAKKANLWGKAGPWQQYPDRMLMYRARGFAGRDAFPDGLRGMLSIEEARDITGEVLESVEIKFPERKSEQAPATPAAAGSEGTSQGANGGSAVAAAEQAVASAPSSTLPTGCDRIIAAERPRTDKPTLTVAKTERGVNVYAYDSRANLTELKGKVVRLILGTTKWGELVEVMKAEVVS